jgi:ribosomal protein S18 acetylase RimI-like enzyme
MSVNGARVPTTRIISKMHERRTEGESLSIRPAELQDAPAIARIHIRSWQVAYRGQLPGTFLDSLDSDLERRTSQWERNIATAADRGWTQLVGEHAGAVVGFVTFGRPDDPQEDPTVGQLHAIYLDPTYWNQGYGRALFAAAESGLAEARYRGALLWVLETNARARRFYERAGWIADGTKKVEARGNVELREARYRRGFAMVER